MGGIAGVVAFGLLLFLAGAIADRKRQKAAWLAGALALCVVIILASGGGPVSVAGGDCYIDWDGRSNSTVCN